MGELMDQMAAGGPRHASSVFSLNWELAPGVRVDACAFCAVAIQSDEPYTLLAQIFRNVWAHMWYGQHISSDFCELVTDGTTHSPYSEAEIICRTFKRAGQAETPLPADRDEEPKTFTMVLPSLEATGDLFHKPLPAVRITCRLVLAKRGCDDDRVLVESINSI